MKFSTFILLSTEQFSLKTRDLKRLGIHDVIGGMGFLRILKYIVIEKLVNFISIVTINYVFDLLSQVYVQQVLVEST